MKGRRSLRATRATIALALLGLAGSACTATGAVRAQEPEPEPDPRPVTSSGEEWGRRSVATVTRPGDVARSGIGISRTARPTSAISRRPFISRKDSIEWIRARNKARDAKGLRVVVSLFDRALWVVNDEDTLRLAPAAVVMRSEFEYEGRKWDFNTPRGRRTVRRKEADPAWVPPDWHYAEVARDHGLKLRALPKRGYRLSDGRRLVIRDSVVGLIIPGYEWAPLPIDEEIVFQSTLFIPPIGTKNRRIEGELGKYKLDLGDGFLLHGTPYENTIGQAATHGCVRLKAEDIEWLYNNIPVGTSVYIY
jgi:lipoprotein-anchoring transpeptidase ErfK/SrfK